RVHPLRRLRRGAARGPRGHPPHHLTIRTTAGSRSSRQPQHELVHAIPSTACSTSVRGRTYPWPVTETLKTSPVLVVDYGAQYAQLIARRVREAKIYSEVVPHTMPVAEMLAREPAAVILSGGPASVYADDAPALDVALLEAGVPVFGMCFGFQAMATALGGTIERTGLREYGSTRARISGRDSTLFTGQPAEQS